MESLGSLVMVDGSPDIEHHALAVDFSVRQHGAGLPLHADASGFGGPDAVFVAEMRAVGELEDLFSRGTYFVNMLYTFRSCARAMSQVVNTAAPSDELGEEHQPLRSPGSAPAGR